MGLNTTHLEYNTPSGQVILPSKIVKDLGVYLSNDIAWSAQVIASSPPPEKGGEGFEDFGSRDIGGGWP